MRPGPISAAESSSSTRISRFAGMIRLSNDAFEFHPLYQ
jgi:hypothetical protein